MESLIIYGQEFEHDDAYIVGNRDSLKKLADIILLAAGGDMNSFQRSPYFYIPTDGEGYNVTVIVTEKENLAVPYFSELSKEYEPSKNIWPWEFLKK